MLELIALLVGGLAVLIALGAWRLSSGPIAVDFLTPYLEEALVSSDNSFFAELDDLSLTWSGWKEALTLRAEKVTIRRADGTVLTRIPSIDIDLSARAAFRGEIAATKLVINAPEIQLRRDNEGRIALGITDDGEGEGEQRESIATFLSGLAAPPNRDHPSGYLTRLEVLNADIVMVDDRTGLVWQVPDGEIKVERDRVGLRLDLGLDVNMGGERMTTLNASGLYNRQLESIALGVHFSEFEPMRLAARVPAFGELKRIQATIAGQVNLAVDITGRVIDTEFDIWADRGKLFVPEFYEQGFEIDFIRTSGHLGRNFDVLEIKELLIDLGGPAILATGEARGLRGNASATLDVAASDMPIDWLERWWPAGVGKGARRWIGKNLHDGVVHQVSASVALKAEGSSGGIKVEVEKLQGTMKAGGMSVDYLDGMPQVRNAGGVIYFDKEKFDIHLETGQAEGLKLNSGRVLITGFDQPDESIAIDLKIAGPVDKALFFINNPPLRFPDKLGIDPSDVGGKGDVDLHFHFKLLEDVDLNDLNTHAVARLSDVIWRDFRPGLDIDGGKLILDVTDDRMVAEGKVTVSGHPLDVTWTESFDDNAEIVSRMTAQGQVDERFLADAGVDLVSYIIGPVGLNLNYQSLRNGTERISAEADLQAARMKIDDLYWSKETGVKGLASVVTESPPEGPTKLNRLVFVGGGLTMRGRGSLGGDTAPTRLELSEMAFGRSVMNGSLVLETNGNTTIDVSGPSFDASRHYDALWGEGDANDRAEAPGSKLVVRAKFEKVYLAAEQDRHMNFVDFSLMRRGVAVEEMSLKAVLPDSGKDLSVILSPDDTSRTIFAETQDAGGLIKLLNIADTVRGGELKIVGRIDDSAERPEADAKLTIRDFKVVNAPILAQVLTVASFTGIVDALSGNGISFNILEGRVLTKGDLYTLLDGRANGPAIGMTMAGSYRRDLDKLDLSGTLVPAYFLNSLLGNIPLLGQILVGEKGSGIFAAAYRVEGPRNKPEVTVNPLSALVPGVLRNIFAPAEGGERAAPPKDIDDPVYPFRENRSMFAK